MLILGKLCLGWHRMEAVGSGTGGASKEGEEDVRERSSHAGPLVWTIMRRVPDLDLRKALSSQSTTQATERMAER